MGIYFLYTATTFVSSFKAVLSHTDTTYVSSFKAVLSHTDAITNSMCLDVFHIVGHFVPDNK